MFKLFWIFTSLLFTLSAYGDCCCHNSQVADFQALIQKVSIVGDENRYIYPVYKKKHDLTDEQMHTLTSGTGEFYCIGFQAGANLVSSNGCLALSSHSFIKKKANGQCERFVNRQELKNCYFQAMNSNGKHVGPPMYVNETTLRVTAGTNHCRNEGSVGNDWAVVQLRFDVPESLAVPYEVADAAELGPLDDDNKVAAISYEHPLKVSVVAMGALNFKEDTTAPTVCDGAVGFLGIGGDEPDELATTSCSSGDGNSGAGITIQRGRNRPPALFGILTRGKPDSLNGMPYGVENNSMGVPIQDAFLKTIQECQKRPAINR